MGIIDEKVAPVVARGARRARAEAKTRKSAATRERIMRAACDLMSERGSTNFQMSEVSSRCGMSKGSLYYYFADKESLLHAVFDRSVAELADQVGELVANAPSAADSIFQLVRELARSVRPGGPLALAMARGSQDGSRGTLASVEKSVGRIISVLTAQIERGKVEGLVLEHVNSRNVAIAIVGAFAFFDYFASGEAEAPGAAGGFGGQGGPAPAREEEFDAGVRNVLDVVLSGIGTPRARGLFSSSPSRGEAPSGTNS